MKRLALMAVLWRCLGASGEVSADVCPAGGCADADVGSELSQWVTSQGAEMNGIEVKQLPSGERGVFAAKDLPKGHAVLTVPVELLVTLHLAASTPLGRAVLEAHDAEPFSDLDGLLLTAWLLHEGDLGDSSGWKTYLDSLPTSFPTLGFNYTEEAVRTCAGGLRLEEYILSRRGLLDVEHKRLAEQPQAAQLTKERFLRARFAVFSRTFTLSRMKLNFDIQMNMGKLWVASSRNGLGGDVAKDEAMALIPFADMINHADAIYANAKWKYEGMGSGFAIRTKRDVAAGEELYMTYGDKGNDMFLAHYGFVVPGNRFDKMPADLRLGDPGEEGATHPIQINGDRPADIETIEGLLEACRAEAAKQPGAADASPAEAEARALRVLIAAVGAETERLRPPEGCSPVCATYRESLQALAGTWRVFAERALGLLDSNSSDVWDTPAPEQYLIHARLYMGVWFRNKGRRVVSLDKVSRDVLQEAQEFGSVRYMDTMPDIDID